MYLLGLEWVWTCDQRSISSPRKTERGAALVDDLWITT